MNYQVRKIIKFIVHAKRHGVLKNIVNVIQIKFFAIIVNVKTVKISLIL